MGGDGKNIPEKQPPFKKNKKQILNVNRQVPNKQVIDLATINCSYWKTFWGGEINLIKYFFKYIN